jgi:DNA-binding LytR/AlgR family response regulator
VIFTTAFHEYALEGFKVNALDYLLKPFNYEEFLTSANKAKEWFELTSHIAGPGPEPYIFVRSEYKQVKIPLNEVLYFEGCKDYIKIWLVNKSKPVMTLMSLKALEKELPPGSFMRIHRSFIIALNKIQAIDRSHVIINTTVRILVAEQYKNAFQDFINNKSVG